MPSSILGKIANGMYNFAKNTYKGYKNPATIASILGHINSKNWKAGLGYMTGSILARMRGRDLLLIHQALQKQLELMVVHLR
jgi:hypothetical protein